jgi:hypothetical protein
LVDLNEQGQFDRGGEQKEKNQTTEHRVAPQGRPVRE